MRLVCKWFFVMFGGFGWCWDVGDTASMDVMGLQRCTVSIGEGRPPQSMKYGRDAGRSSYSTLGYG